jgi:hypothetical protein
MMIRRIIVRKGRHQNRNQLSGSALMGMVLTHQERASRRFG